MVEKLTLTTGIKSLQFFPNKKLLLDGDVVEELGSFSRSSSVSLSCVNSPVKMPNFFSSSAKKGQFIHTWYFVSRIALTYCEKNRSSDWEKLLKFEAEDGEFAKLLRSLQEFIWKLKDQYNFQNR